MRQARDGSFLVSAEGKLIAINLGADFVAEHEWGVQRLKSSFGIPTYQKTDNTDAGVARRKVRSFPIEARYSSALQLLKLKDCTVLIFGGYGFDKVKDFKTACGAMRVYGEITPEKPKYDGKPQDFLAAWDESSFGVVAKDEVACKHLETLYEAFKGLDAAIWVGGAGVFQNGGLVLAVYSNIPKENVDSMREKELEAVQVQVDMAETGIEKLLADAGKRYYALSPSRKADGSLQFWLNPQDQRSYESRWSSLEELKQWAEDKGPIIKKK